MTIKNDGLGCFNGMKNALVLYILIALVVSLSACGSTGWRVSFGVSPVTAIQEAQQMKMEDSKK